MQSAPVTLCFPSAPAAILAHAGRLCPAPPHILIGITGPVGAGKSTLAGALTNTIVHTDDFLPDYTAVPYAERDDPTHADLALLASILDDLRRGGPTRAPTWSHHTHRREGHRDLHPAPIIAVEGIHALHPDLTPHLHIRLYVDAPAATRWQRWEAIERAGGRGMGLEAARRFFHEVAEPAFTRHGAAGRGNADFIVVNQDAQP